MMRTVLAAIVLATAMAGPAFAYVGPGAGVSLIGAVIGLFTALATAVGVIVMMPIRAARKKKQLKKEAAAGDGSAAGVNS